MKNMRTIWALSSIFLAWGMILSSGMCTSIFGQSGKLNGHDYVDLGLPSGTKWATCNLGSSSPSDYGEYFESVYNDVYYGRKGEDIVSKRWGTGWVMPSFNDFLELKNNCTWQWTTQNGKNGYIVRGRNGNYVFLPAAGLRSGSNRTLQYAGSYGRYWSSTYRIVNRMICVYELYFDSGHYNVSDSNQVSQEQCIRPVTHR